jgi:galactosamine-6-phosphate isomerase
MQFKIFRNIDILSDFASEFILNEYHCKNDLLLCTASGGSPTETYKKFVLRNTDFSFENLRILKLDEWGGVPYDHEDSCESYLQNLLIKPLQIKVENYYSFQSEPSNPHEECARIQQLIEQKGPIDVCILGLGMNGHIAFNEPADYLQADCHVAALSEASMNHPMAKNMSSGSVYGLSMGMGNILNSKKIVMIITGMNKTSIIKQFLSKKISTQLPASFLWLHPDVYCLFDEESCDSEILEIIKRSCF